MDNDELERTAKVARDCACNEPPYKIEHPSNNGIRASGQSKKERRDRIDQKLVEDVAHQFYGVNLNPAWVLVLVCILIFIGYVIVGDPVTPDQTNLFNVIAK